MMFMGDGWGFGRWDNLAYEMGAGRGGPHPPLRGTFPNGGKAFGAPPVIL